MARTVMSFTKLGLRGLAFAGALAGLCACANAADQQAEADFGRALHEDIVAQIADPDREAAPHPPAVSDGARVGLAMERYRTGKVIEPQPATASRIGVVMEPNGASGSGQ